MLNTIEKQTKELYKEYCGQCVLGRISSHIEKQNRDDYETFYKNTVEDLTSMMLDVFQDKMCNPEEKSDLDIMCENNPRIKREIILLVSKHCIIKTIKEAIEQMYIPMMSKHPSNEA